MSHFHLYRINPDGAGREQITFGNNDDTDPVWSPDGQWIAFGRADNSLSQTCELSVLDVATGHIRQLTKCDWDEFRPKYYWQPQPLRLILPHPDKDDETVFTVSPKSISARQSVLDDPHSTDGDWRANIDDGQHLVIRHHSDGAWTTIRSKPGAWLDFAWIDKNSLAALRERDSGYPDKLSGQILDVFSLKTPQSIAAHEYPIHLSTKLSKDFESLDLGPGGVEADYISAWPAHPDSIVLHVNETNSTSGSVVDYLGYTFRNGHVPWMADYAEFISFSPNGALCATAPGRMPAPYSHWHGGQVRSVWAAPLYVVDTKSGKKRQLTPSTTWVYSADWRK